MKGDKSSTSVQVHMTGTRRIDAPDQQKLCTVMRECTQRRTGETLRNTPSRLLSKTVSTSSPAGGAHASPGRLPLILFSLKCSSLSEAGRL